MLQNDMHKAYALEKLKFSLERLGEFAKFKFSTWKFERIWKMLPNDMHEAYVMEKLKFSLERLGEFAKF